MIARRVSVNPILASLSATTPRYDCKAGLCQSHPGITASNSQVTCQGHLQTSPKSNPIQGCYDRHWQFLPGSDYFSATCNEWSHLIWCHLGSLLQICSCAESAFRMRP